MSKRPSLAESLRGVAAEPAPPPLAEPPSREPQVAKPPAASKVLPARAADADAEPKSKAFYAATRAGKKKATAPLSGPAHQQLKILSVEQGGTVEAMLIEAINDLFRKYRKEPIA